MTNEILVLCITAASIGFIHTIFGPDHYVPFVAMSKARHWSHLRTVFITVLCGIGHVLGSVVLGLVGVAIGIAVFKLEAIEAGRGDLAAWALIAFGLVYVVWGVRNAVRKHSHNHLLAGHSHTKTKHNHDHTDKDKANITPWILFTVFVLGPCEPLIPILMYPAAQNSTSGIVLVTLVFGIVTISTMTAAVLLLTAGIGKLRFSRWERYSHAIAGFSIFLCGIAIQLGL